MKRLLIMFACLVLSASAHAASFDCAKAGTKVEKLICNDVELSKLDSELAEKYVNATQDKTNADVIKPIQKRWLVNVRNKCVEITCLKQAYQNRLRVLEESVRHKVSESYSLVMSKDDDLCKHMLQEFNDDLKRHGWQGYNYHERHEEFMSIPWEKARYSVEDDSRIRYVDVEAALFDLNNDGIQDFVIFHESALSGMRADELFMLDADVSKRANVLTSKELRGSNNLIRIAGSWGYPLTAPLDGEKAALWLLSPFKYRVTHYLFMRSVGAGLMSNISVIAKYKNGSFELGDMTGKMEDICYYKYNGAMRDLQPHGSESRKLMVSGLAMKHHPILDIPDFLIFTARLTLE